MTIFLMCFLVFISGFVCGALYHAYRSISCIAENKNISFFDAVDLLQELEGEK